MVGNSTVLSDPHDQNQSTWEIERALAAGEFFLVYQPTFRLCDLTVTGAEALIRWRHPSRGVLSPDEFIPCAEASGLIRDVGRWALDTACTEAAGWQNQQCRPTVAVNVSGRQVESDQLVTDVGAALDRSGLSPALLTLEITETALAHDLAAGAARLCALKGLGVGVSLDDFGTGYSSLRYLSHFPVDVLKIDRSFIGWMDRSPQTAIIVRTLIQLGRALGIKTLAEGIEAGGQLHRLQADQCDEGQGFLLASPMSGRAFQRLAISGAGADCDQMIELTDGPENLEFVICA